MSNPTTILAAFAPEATPLVLTMEGVLLLEAEENSFLKGGEPSYRDVVAAALVLADPKGYALARRNGTLDEYVADKAAGMSPRALMAMLPQISAAMAAAFAPLEGAGEPEKKQDPAPAAAGG